MYIRSIYSRSACTGPDSVGDDFRDHEARQVSNLSGFLFNFQWGKAVKDGADHLISVAYNQEYFATYPVTAVEQLIAVGSAMGWDMTRGYLFPSIARDAEGGAPIRTKALMSAAVITHSLKSHARAAGEKADFSMHYFRSGGGNHKGVESGGPLLHHGAGLLEEAQGQYGMEVRENHESSVTRRGRKRVGERGLGGAVQEDQQILVEGAE